jgi:hypothetical protein
MMVHDAPLSRNGRGMTFSIIQNLSIGAQVDYSRESAWSEGTFIRGHREISRCLSVTEENLLHAEMSHEERLRWQTGSGADTER